MVDALKYGKGVDMEGNVFFPRIPYSVPIFYGLLSHYPLDKCSQRY